MSLEDSTDWENLEAYRCRFCREECINGRETELATQEVCRTCRPYLSLSGEDSGPSLYAVLCGRFDR